MDDPKVTVVVTCFNLARFLEEAVESVLAQTMAPESVELIIVDDGSSDGSVELARALVARNPKRSIRVLELANGGVSRARNRAIETARGEYVLCLDGDDLLDSRFLELCAAVLDENPHVSIAYSSHQNFGEDDRFDPHLEYDAGLLAHANLLGSNSLFRRRAWVDAGGYSEEATSYEDWDFWISCAEAGHFGRLVPEKLWYYRIRPDSKYRQIGVKHDLELKARIVLRHAGLYSEDQRAWARDVLRGDQSALAAGSQLGMIPGFQPSRSPGASPIG